MIQWLHTFTPDAVAFTIGPITVWWYGVGYVIGITLGFLVSYFLVKRRGLGIELLWDLAFWVVVAGLIGARLWYIVAIEPAYYFSHPAAMIKIWEGGMAIHGALGGGIIALLVWCRKHAQSFWQWADHLVPAVVTGQMIGRFGNWANQELYGVPTDRSWGIPIELPHRIAGFESYAYFHPTFLYEILLNAGLLIILLLLHRKREQKSGMIMAAYLAGYGIIRAAVDSIRIDPVPLMGGVRITTLTSIAIFFIAIFIYGIRRRQHIR